MSTGNPLLTDTALALPCPSPPQPRVHGRAFRDRKREAVPAGQGSGEAVLQGHLPPDPLSPAPRTTAGKRRLPHLDHCSRLRTKRVSFQLTFCECGRQQDILSLLALGIYGVEYHRDILFKTQIQDSVVSREGILLHVQSKGCNETAETALCSYRSRFRARLTCLLHPKPATVSD